MIEVKVDAVRVNLQTQNRVLFLKEIHGTRQLLIWIGDWEAKAITLRLQDVPQPRPLPYQLWLKTIEELGGTVVRGEVSELRDDIFYARVVLSQGEKIIELDTRPSDAATLAVYAGVPIFVANDLLDRASINVDDDPPTPDSGANGAADSDDGPPTRRATTECANRMTRWQPGHECATARIRISLGDRPTQGSTLSLDLAGRRSAIVGASNPSSTVVGMAHDSWAHPSTI